MQGKRIKIYGSESMNKPSL